MFAYRFLKKNLSQSQRTFIRRWVNRLSAPIPNQPLNVIALKHGTDKLFHGYCEHYERHFAALRHQPLNVLEIGVGGYTDPHTGGESLRMWQEYFPKGMIYSIDIEDKRPLEDKRIRIFRGSQNDPEFLERIVAQIGRIDLIIDDGSHVSEHVITSFRTLFPHLVVGGIYVIEDLHTAYWSNFGGGYPHGGVFSSMDMLFERVDGLHHNFIRERTADYFDQHISQIHLYPKIAFIVKGVNQQQYPTEKLWNLKPGQSEESQALIL